MCFGYVQALVLDSWVTLNKAPFFSVRALQSLGENCCILSQHLLFLYLFCKGHDFQIPHQPDSSPLYSLHFLPDFSENVLFRNKLSTPGVVAIARIREELSPPDFRNDTPVKVT